MAQFLTIYYSPDNPELICICDGITLDENIINMFPSLKFHVYGSENGSFEHENITKFDFPLNLDNVLQYKTLQSRIKRAISRKSVVGHWMMGPASASNR